VAAFAIDDRLSAPLPRVGVDEWIEALLDRSGGPPRPGRVITVTVAAESLGLAPGSRAWCFDDGWLSRWLDASSGGRPEVRCVLPAEAYEAARPAVRFALRPGCAPSIGAVGRGAGRVDWTDFQRHAIEADTLYRRMLQVSEKLRDAIGTMEDEELEDDWSDSLATAQRLVFAAQAPDAYWRGPTGGFTDPAVRDAVMGRLSSAANLIDQLVQGEDDWIGEEEEDRDGDLVDEVLVSTARLNAWLVPAHGAAVRSLESRAGERNVLDAGTRRVAATLPSASPVDTGARDEPVEEPTLPAARWPGVAAPPRSERETIDPGRCGIVTHVFEVGTSPPELDSGSAVPLAALESGWELVENAIDEEGDCSYAMTVTAAVPLAGISPRTLTLRKRVRVPIDAGELEISYTATLEGAPDVLLVTEIPLRLGAGLEVVEAGGTPADPGATELFDVDVVRLRGGDEVIEVRCSRASDFWCLPVGNELITPEGRRPVDDGLVLVHPMRVEGSTSFTLTITLSPGTDVSGDTDRSAGDDESSGVPELGNEDPTIVLGDPSGDTAALDAEDDGPATVPDDGDTRVT
jgi:hypothetical protein